MGRQQRHDPNPERLNTSFNNPERQAGISGEAITREWRSSWSGGRDGEGGAGSGKSGDTEKG